MPFSHYFKFIAILLIGLVSYPMAAAGKIRFAIGDERKIIDTKGKETDAKTGGKIREKDKVRTGIESQVIVALPDGSIISVEENSLVEFTNLNSSNGVQSAVTDIKQGKVRFDAQRQKGKSKFSFKTGTATAAIRGTDGIVGLTPKGFSVFGLNSGSMDISDECGAKGSIAAGELMFSLGKKCGLQKVRVTNAGDENIINKVMQTIDDANGEIDSAAVAKMTEALNKLIETIKKQKITEAGCNVTPLSDITPTHSVNLKMTCNHSQKQILVNGILAGENVSTVEKTVDWEPTFIGEKRFEFTCIRTIDVAAEAAKKKIPSKIIPQGMKSITLQYPCGEAKTHYYNATIDSANRANIEKAEQDSIAAAANPIQVNANTDDICSKGSVTLEISFVAPPFEPTQNTLITIKAGTRTNEFNIPASEHTFSYILPIKDVAQNWDATSIDISVTFPDGQTRSVSLPVAANKACKAVNTIKPGIAIQPATTGLKCVASYKVSGNDADVALVSIFSDNELIMEKTAVGNEGGTFQLIKGKHVHKLVVTDQAKNESSASMPMPCYDANAGAYVTINGKRNPSTGGKRYPKPPPKYDNVIHETIRVKINKLSQNDLSQVESILVTQDGKTGYLLNLSNSNNSIDEDEFTLPVDIEYGIKTTFRVKVKLYNGRILANSITYNDYAFKREAP